MSDNINNKIDEVDSSDSLTIKKTPSKKKIKRDTVAIHSTKNVLWPGIGEVTRGYNIVTEEVAEKWLTRNHIRSATPEEVAREFGVK
jgi:hypothetical protein